MEAYPTAVPQPVANPVTPTPVVQPAEESQPPPPPSPTAVPLQEDETFTGTSNL